MTLAQKCGLLILTESMIFEYNRIFATNIFMQQMSVNASDILYIFLKVFSISCTEKLKIIKYNFLVETVKVKVV